MDIRETRTRLIRTFSIRILALGTYITRFAIMARWRFYDTKSAIQELSYLHIRKTELEALIRSFIFNAQGLSYNFGSVTSLPDRTRYRASK